ncbi:MAG: proton-conducting transporter membrane subunit, partial [Propionibacteriaceae bacterium]|nr:proton-conducting transporter membrane subunit [Propionibacteriaceae bacterium]
FAIFHLITHGFFKANMFLGAGSVMHGMDDEVDMRKFGGLSKAMRITFLTFGAGYLAIIGFPFTAGFYSKDHIIEAAFESNTTLGVLALIGAGVTAYYMTRLMVMTFFGDRRWKDDAQPHESPLTMTVPLIVLGVLSLVAGLAMNGWIQGWLAPATGAEVHESGLFDGFTGIIPLVTLATVALGVAIGWFLHRSDIPRTAPDTRNPLVLAGRADLYGDALNEYAIIRPVGGLVAGTEALDHGVVDGAVMGSASLAGGFGSWLRRAQNGYVRTYGLTFVIGIVAIAAVMIFGQLV